MGTNVNLKLKAQLRTPQQIRLAGDYRAQRARGFGRNPRKESQADRIEAVQVWRFRSWLEAVLKSRMPKESS